LFWAGGVWASAGTARSARVQKTGNFFMVFSDVGVQSSTVSNATPAGNITTA
jgi:hypothetical protein